VSYTFTYRDLSNVAETSLQITSFRQGDQAMLRWALICLIVALVASAFGFFQLEGAAMEAAKILFFVFLVLFVITLLAGRRGPPV
jgi:uncharacterized membrane protein YtjA (UPF0391 family)